MVGENGSNGAIGSPGINSGFPVNDSKRQTGLTDVVTCRSERSGESTSKRQSFIESLLFFCCFLRLVTHLGFARIIRNGERTRFLG